MKYFIAVIILVVFCVNANAQKTAGSDDKAVSASIGQCTGYSYGVDYTFKNGKTVDNSTEKVIVHTGKVTADKEIKAADNDKNGRYPYEVIYTVSSEKIVQSR